ncbi:MAG: oligosaccharide flippase family protein [Candidatus Absconditabacteria bacterium]
MLNNDTLSKKLIKNGFWLYLFTILSAPTGYIIRVIISNDLTVSDVGIIYTILGFVTLLSAYNDFGLTETLKFYLPKFWINKQVDYIKTAIFMSLGVQLITGIMLGCLMFFGAGWLSVNYFQSPQAFQILQIFALYFFFINMVQVLGSIFLAFQNSFAQQLLDVSRMWLIAILSITFFALGIGSSFLYGAAWVVGTIIASFIGIYIFLTRYKNLLSGKIVYDKVMLKDYIKYSLRIFIGINAGTILGQIDQQMIMYYLGAEKAGYYSNFLSLSNLYSLLIGPISIFLFPLITEITNKNQPEKLQLLRNFFYKYFSLIGISMGGILLVLAPIVSIILYGAKFEYSGVLMQYLACFIVLNNLITLNFTYLSGIGKVKYNVMIIIGACIINVIMNILLITRIGPIGAVISMICGRIFMFTASYKIITKEHPIRFDFRFFFKNLFLIAIFVLAVYMVKDSIFSTDDTQRLYNLLYLIIIGILYGSYLGLVNLSEIKMLKNEIMALKKK